MNIIHDYIATALLISILKLEAKDESKLDSSIVDLYDDITGLYLDNIYFVPSDWAKIVAYAKSEINLKKNLN